VENLVVHKLKTVKTAENTRLFTKLYTFSTKMSRLVKKASRNMCFVINHKKTKYEEKNRKNKSETRKKKILNCLII